MRSATFEQVEKDFKVADLEWRYTRLMIAEHFHWELEYVDELGEADRSDIQALFGAREKAKPKVKPGRK